MPSADRYINCWVSYGMIEKVGHGEFRRGIKKYCIPEKANGT